MKLLLDQNISFRVIKNIQSNFPNSEQVKRLGLEATPDIKIWEFAKSNDFTTVTFDADFSEIANLNGHPPKIIWLRFGNNTSSSIAEILNLKQVQIVDFIKGEDCKKLSCLEIF